jgi:hypothetical protein
VFSGFVSTPWSYPLMTWFGEEASPESKKDVWWYANEGELWDGLVVDLAAFLNLEPSLTRS